RPNQAEIRACRPWLDLEREIVRPELVVALGATAAQAILGPAFRITGERGRIVPAGGDRDVAPVGDPPRPKPGGAGADAGRVDRGPRGRGGGCRGPLSAVAEPRV